jgi:hypothetical protein
MQKLLSGTSSNEDVLYLFNLKKVMNKMALHGIFGKPRDDRYRIRGMK